MSMSLFCIPKVLKSATKFFKNRLTNQNFMQENILNRAFSIVKLPAKEVVIFSEKKSKLIIFHLKHNLTKTKLFCICII